tara:strand:+ start:672 stop:1292 length:621 start_codon:yes stop_codon:yes gene_type:complete
MDGDSIQNPLHRLVLASKSPRRKRILEGAGVSFRIVPADIDESEFDNEGPSDLVKRLSYQKAKTVKDLLGKNAHTLVLGADTIVVLGSEIMGKPTSAAHAEEMLLKLTGNRHKVMTGVSILNCNSEKVYCRIVTSEVTMQKLPLRELQLYSRSEEVRDKAGAYAIQGKGGAFVEKVIGSESNVIGLPLDETLALLREAGYFKLDEL